VTRSVNGDPKTVVILGGGIGGVATANRLRRRLHRRHRIVLINRDPDFTFAASYLWVMSGQRRASQITRPLRELERRGIEVVIGNVTAIDPANRSVSVDGNQIVGDYLVVSLGADYADDTIPGLREAGATFATLSGAEQLGRSVGSIASGRILVVTGAPLYRCPAAPYEAALLVDAMLRQSGRRAKVDVAIHSAEPGPMAVAGANVSAAVVAMLAERNIDYQPSHQIASAESGRVQFADGNTQDFDLLAYMPPIRSPRVIAESPLASTNGWIEADRHTLATSFPGVYAIGDNTQTPLSIGKPLPRAGVFAHGQALVVADNIAAQIEGAPTTASFDGKGGCFIESGFGRAGYGSGDFFAEPSPSVAVRPPSRRNHWGKVLFEYNVLRRWF
jgi:sulfide:quinone oxidoreductase